MFSEALSVTATAVKNRRVIRDAFVQLWSLITRGHVRVVVFGSAGAGKSTLGAVLAGEEVPAEYEESTRTESYRLDADSWCSVLVPPGQEGLRASTWSDLSRYVTNGESTIVLHVVCWGLTAIEPLGYREVEGIYREGMDPRSFVDAYSQHRRAHEIETLKGLSSKLELAPKKLSLLTVITKQDLWWGQREMVRVHYETDYAPHLASLRQQIGDQNFSHKFWSASLLGKNMKDGEGTLLVPTAEGYDDQLRAYHTQRLSRMITEMVAP
ncbi:Rab family GTPase [Enhygromyxa salina]|uniref:Rab family GTPase n=1 Tax=Enhygromyxa salina TaxID=215803 RepID=UPI0011B2585B|nr:hypothetical protein [Enhygromyxa salina]